MTGRLATTAGPAPYTEGMTRTNTVAVGLVALLTLASAAVRAADPLPSPTRILGDAVRDSSFRRGHEALDGLRNLRDPSLRPLFSSLASAKDPEQRRQGVLGLAELETPPRLNPLLLSRLADSAEQAVLLGEGLSLDLIGTEQIDQILAWPNLKPYIELLLRARLAREGKPIDQSRVAVLATQGDMPSELLGAALLAQAGQPAHLDVVAGRLLGLADPIRGALVGPFLETILRERLTKSTPILGRLSAVYANYPSLAADILSIWIRLAPSEGLPVLKAEWDKARGLPDRLRLARVALDASDLADPELFVPIAASKDNEALSAMGRLGGVLARKEPPIPALHDLIKLRYLVAELWVVDRMKQWDKETAAETCRAIITAWAERPTMPEPISDAVLPAAKWLVEADRDFLASALAKACERTDERIATAVVMALLAKGAAPVWDVNNPPRWPDKVTEGVALLVFARSVEPAKFPESRTPALEGIAAGVGARLPPWMRAQAAWTLVKIRGRGEETLARLLAGEN